MSESLRDAKALLKKFGPHCDTGHVPIVRALVAEVERLLHEEPPWANVDAPGICTRGHTERQPKCPACHDMKIAVYESYRQRAEQAEADLDDAREQATGALVLLQEMTAERDRLKAALEVLRRYAGRLVSRCLVDRQSATKCREDKSGTSGSNRA
jgi:hypothetical protein